MALIVQVEVRIAEERNLEELLQVLKLFQAQASGYIGIAMAVVGTLRSADEVNNMVLRAGLRSVKIQTDVPLYANGKSPSVH